MVDELSPEELKAISAATAELFGSFETPRSKKNEESIAEPGRYKAEDVADMPDEDEEEPELIADWLPASGMVEIYGAPKAGKSWLGLDWALHVATGTDWHGAKVQQSRVLYLIGEGRREIRKRVRAWYKAKGIKPKKGQVSFVYRPFILGAEAIKGLVTDNPGLFEGPNRVRLTFVDTVNRFMGGNENDTRDTSDFVKACDALRAEDCLVMLHHTGRHNQSRPRGSNVIDAAVDAKISVEKDKGKIKVQAVELRSGANPNPMIFEIKSFEYAPGKLAGVLRKSNMKSISPAAMEVLQEIADYRPRAQKEIAERLEMDAGTVSKAIKELVEAKYIEPKPSKNELGGLTWAGLCYLSKEGIFCSDHWPGLESEEVEK